jgi:hypothetical protein
LLGCTDEEAARLWADVLKQSEAFVQARE